MLMVLYLTCFLKTENILSDSSVEQDQTARSVQSDLVLHCPQKVGGLSLAANRVKTLIGIHVYTRTMWASNSNYLHFC